MVDEGEQSRAEKMGGEEDWRRCRYGLCVFVLFGLLVPIFLLTKPASTYFAPLQVNAATASSRRDRQARMSGL